MADLALQASPKQSIWLRLCKQLCHKTGLAQTQDHKSGMIKWYAFAPKSLRNLAAVEGGLRRSDCGAGVG